MPSVFSQLAEEFRDAWPDLARRPVRVRCSDARVLDPQTAIAADCEAADLRRLFREWHDRGTAEEMAESLHQMDLERAAQPPVIEVTVTTPPGGIPRASLERLVAEKVSEFTGPASLPRPARQMLTVARRPSVPRDVMPPLPVSEDDTPTVALPAVRGGFAAEEVRVP